MIAASGLTKSFGNEPVVRDVSFEVAAGELLVLVGPSGCGKTTTLKMLNRLVEPTSGTVHIAGEDTRDIAPHLLRRRVGYGFQQAGLFPHLTVAENVGITPRLLGWSSDEIDARVETLLELVQLDPSEFAARDPASLSSGQQQRVSLARALAAKPDVLLLDEPFGALDPVTRDHLQRALLRLRDELDVAIVFVTHDMLEALLLADRICVLDHGEIVQLGTPRELLQNPADERVAHLLEMPRRQAKRVDSLLDETGVDGNDVDG